MKPKHTIAKAIHYNSGRRERPFVGVSCAALPETLLESELFGHEKGAFTGATKTRIGRFEQAEGGTIFLDEIGDIPLPTQAKLLRVLQERQFERAGGNDIVRVDVRLISATNKDLRKAKQDLLDRFEREYISRLLDRNKGNITDAARDAELDYKNFFEKMKRHGLSKWDFKE